MKHKAFEIPTDKLQTLLNNKNELLVDLRTVEAYNGWKLNNEKRGGHISGAISFPFAWTNYKFELPEFLKAKNITQKKSITLYSDNSDDLKLMADMLIIAGYFEVKIYTKFIDEWISNESLPMDYLPGYQKLLYPQWLHELMNDKKPVGYDGDNYVICHAHYDNYDDYLEGHIPGAIALNTLELESPETWNCRTPAELKETLLNHGIRHDTTVILYGRFSYPRNEDYFPGKRAGQLAAMRCAIILMYAGVKDVKLLNGSILAWEKAGFKLSTTVYKPNSINDFGIQIPGHPEYIVSTETAKKMLVSNTAELVSIRSWEEFIGKVSGYNYIEQKGRIPGAIFGNCGTDAYHMENYRNPDLTMRAANEVSANWSEVGIVPEKHIAFYCGTGWRGSEAFLNAWLMGWPNVSVYDGGWMEWSSNPNNPIETGELLKAY